MTSVSAQNPGARRRDRTFVDALLAAVPVCALVLAVLVFYAVEAWTRKTPWLFGDELEWTQISRSIAATGHAARRGQPIYFKSLYAFAIAPFWWIHSTAAAYAAVKYANAVMMPLAAIPTYLLARMLVSRRSAVIVAVLSVAAPGMAYVTSIIPEVAFYPYYALCSWLAVRALRSGKRLDVFLAVAFTVGGYLIKQRESVTLPAALAIAAAGLWVTGPRGRAFRRNWTRGDTLGAVVLLVGALFLFNRVVLQHVAEWQVTTENYKSRIVDLGLRAGLSFTIGMGILPVIGGLASLHLPERRGDPTYRAFAAWTAATVLCLGVYAADKAAYLSTVFGTFWEERNLIYLGPLLLIGTALVLESKRIDWRAVGAAALFVALILVLKGIQTGYPYFEAPGSAIPAVLANYRHWSLRDLRIGLFGVFALSLVILAARRRRGVAPAALALLLVWLLAGEIAMTAGIDKAANAFRANLPARLDWVDAHDQGRPVTYLGQSVSANNLWLTEFWNRSIANVDSLDNTAPGPGPTAIPGLLSATGLLSDYTGDPYVLTDGGVALDAPVVWRQGSMTLYRQLHPWHLAQTSQAVTPDGWCQTWCAYTYFKPGERGTLRVTLSRLAYNGSAPPARVHIRVGAVRIDQNQALQLGRIHRVLFTLVRNATQKTVSIPVARTPVRVEVRIPDPIPPSASDPRQLGAQISFRFVPAGRR